MLTKRGLIWLVFCVVLILLLPFFAMQFTTEVTWKPIDFLLAGGLLFFFGYLMILISKLIKNKTYKWMVIIGLIILLFLIWAEFAVGIFNTPFAGS